MYTSRALYVNLAFYTFNLTCYLFCRQTGAGPRDEISQENSTQDSAPVDQPQVDYPNPCETAFRGTLEVYSWAPTSEQEHDLIPSVDPKRVIELLNVNVTKKGAIRWYLSVQVKFTKPNSEVKRLAQSLILLANVNISLM